MIFFISLIVLTVVPSEVPARSRRRVVLPGARALVVDERLSALRERPDLRAALAQRLRPGRVIGVLGAARDRSGTRFLRVAVTRNTRGWICAEAVVRPGQREDARRLLQLIDETTDDYQRIRLARLLVDEFRAAPQAPQALRLLAAAAERVAERLSRDARRRLGDEAGRDRWLNFPGLDRYNRLGVTFEYDAAGDRLVYDGAAWRELKRRFGQ
ncbi:MAG: hypothetical protein SF339_13650 [Blastocatellia bacterium]|nr:hypothetical protein [Blastocatellia bacterium]